MVSLMFTWVGDIIIISAGVPVSIYQGQLDLICCTLGVDMWLQRLAWPGLEGFQAVTRKPFYREDLEGGKETAGFVRQHKNLAMYYIMKAGEFCSQAYGH